VAAAETPRPSYTLTMTDLETGKRVWETKTESENLLRPPSVVFSPNGAQLALVTQEKNRTAIKVFDTTTRRELSSFDNRVVEHSPVVFSRDGKRIALTYGSAAAGTGFGGSRAMMGADRGEPIVTIHDLGTGPTCLTLDRRSTDRRRGVRLHADAWSPRWARTATRISGTPRPASAWRRW
jgi:WD40 repeat protein